jgi:hypothetical protein
LSLDEVEARLLINGSWTNEIDRSWTDELFGTSEVQEATIFGDVTDALVDAHDVPIMNDNLSEHGSEDEDSAKSALDKDCDECAAAESDE